MGANFGGYNPAQFMTRPGDPLIALGNQLGSAVADAPSRFRDGQQMQENIDRRKHQNSIKDDAFNVVNQFLEKENIALDGFRRANKGETTEEYLTYINNLFNAEIAKNPQSADIWMSKAIAFGERKGMDTSRLREERAMRGHDADFQNRFAPSPPMPDVSQAPPLDSLQSQFGQSAPLGAMGGGMLSAPSVDMEAMSAPLGAPLGAQPSQQLQSRSRFAPNYTQGFEDELRRLADDVSNRRIASSDVVRRRDSIMEGYRKAQIQQDEFDFKTQEGRLDALRKDLFAARGKIQILRRDTREPISEFDSAEMWDDPEAFIIGSALSSDNSLKDAYTQSKIDKNNRWRPSDRSSRDRGAKEPVSTLPGRLDRLNLGRSTAANAGAISELDNEIQVVRGAKAIQLARGGVKGMSDEEALRASAGVLGAITALDSLIKENNSIRERRGTRKRPEIKRVSMDDAESFLDAYRSSQALGRLSSDSWDALEEAIAGGGSVEGALWRLKGIVRYESPSKNIPTRNLRKGQVR